MKSVIQREREAGQKWMPKEDPSPELTLRQLKIEEDKKNLKWRKNLDDDDKIWRSKFGAFMSNENNFSLMIYLQQPWDLRPSALGEKWKLFKKQRDEYFQKYNVERIGDKGVDINAALFVCEWHGKIRYMDFFLQYITLLRKCQNYNLKMAFFIIMFIM